MKMKKKKSYVERFRKGSGEGQATLTVTSRRSRGAENRRNRPPRFSGVTRSRLGFNLPCPRKKTKTPKIAPPLTLTPSINAAASGARRDSRPQRSRLPGTPLFVLVSPSRCTAARLPSLPNCLANISARERQISLFPVDIVLSEPAVTALIIQHLFFFLSLSLKSTSSPHLILSSRASLSSFPFISPFPSSHPPTATFGFYACVFAR